MTYTIHNLVQGSPEWKAHRAGCHNASDLSAAMGSSSYKSRTDLIRQMASGIERDIDAATQRRFDDGHRFEALARPLAEKIIGRDLYPITASIEVDGLARRLSASLDGATDDDSTNFEHKSLNSDLAAALDKGIIPEEYWPQMEQGMLINGAGRTLFMASKSDENDNLIEEKHCWYESRPELRAKIVPTWRQIEEDAASYQHVEAKPSVVVAAIEDLPALNVQINGSVIASNLDGWRETVIARIQAINTDLQSDEDFAVAEKTVTFLSDGEKRLDAVKSAVQSQAADIDAVFRTIDKLRDEMRAKRLNLDKLVKARKESIRMEIMQDAQAKLAEHVKALNERIGWFNGCPIISPAAADFATAIKGKKTVSSLRDGCDTELARAKIATSEIADRIEANRKAMGDHAALFPDFPHVCTKTAEDFANLVAVRVQQQKEVEAKREAERAEAERKSQAAACAVNEAPASRPNLAAEYMRNNPPPSPNASSLDADEPAIWRQAKSGVVAMLDSLTISELEAVADYINRKAWRKAA
jgi:predicted phage-related endonuclease